MGRLKIAPSILSADFAKMGDEIKDVENGCADLIHCDVMDGVFVPNITFGVKMIEDIRKHTALKLDVHLMIIDPIKYVEDFCKAGADIVTIHIEANSDAVATLNKIKQCGVKCGIVLSPDTDVLAVQNVLPLCDMVLVMSVYPGFGGQKFIESSLNKISLLKSIREQNGYSYEIEVDGGINYDTAKLVYNAGCDIAVAGSFVFNNSDRKNVIENLKNVK